MDAKTKAIGGVVGAVLVAAVATIAISTRSPVTVSVREQYFVPEDVKRLEARWNLLRAEADKRHLSIPSCPYVLSSKPGQSYAEAMADSRTTLRTCVWMLDRRLRFEK